MEKFQKIWLMLLSAVLLLGTLITLLVSIDWNPKKCIVNNVEYSSGEEIAEYIKNAVCTCGREGKVICEFKSMSKSFLNGSDFTTKDLVFGSKFLNSLSNTEISISEEIVFRSVSQNEDGLRVVIERLDSCTSSGGIPDQAGFFSLNKNSLILTIIETGDPSKYTKPCVVESTFLLAGISGELDDSFKLYYRTENDEIYLADICVFEGRIYNDGDSYRSNDTKKLCSCKSGENVCNPL